VVRVAICRAAGAPGYSDPLAASGVRPGQLYEMLANSFLIVLQHLIRRLNSSVVYRQFHHPIQKQALGHRIGEELVDRSSFPVSIQSRSSFCAGGAEGEGSTRARWS